MGIAAINQPAEIGLRKHREHFKNGFRLFREVVRGEPSDVWDMIYCVDIKFEILRIS